MLNEYLYIYTVFANIIIWEYQSYLVIIIIVLLLAVIIVNYFRISNLRKFKSTIEKYETLIETTNTGFIALDEKGNVIDANDEYVKLTGHNELSEILNRNVTEWTAPYDLNRNALEVKKCLEKGYVRSLEIDYFHKDKKIVTIEINATVVTVDGSPRIMSLCRDISSLRKTDSELQLQAKIVNSMVEGVVLIKRPDRKIVYANPNFEKMFGYSPGEMINKDIDIIHVKHLKSISENNLISSMEEKGIWSGEACHQRKNGSLIWTQVNISTLNHPAYGQVWVSVHEDISTRKTVEEKLETSQAQLSSILESTNDYILLCDKNAMPVYFNTAYADIMKQLLGFEMKPGFQPHKLLPDKNEQAKWDGYHKRVLSGESFVFESSYPTPDGESLYFEHSFYPVFDAGEVVGFSEFTHNITERRLAELALQESEEKFRTLAENIPSAIFIFNAESMIYVNPKVEEMLGYTSEEIKKFTFWHVIHPEYKELVKERGKMRLSGEKISSSYEVKIITKAGETKWMLYSGDTIEYQGEKAVLGTAFDITEKKEVEEKLRKSEEEKYQNTRQIAGGVAHEIYNALFPATSSLDKLKSRIFQTDPEEIKRNEKLISLMEAALDRALKMTELVTQYSKLEAQKDKEVINLEDFISNLINENPSIINHNVTLIKDIDSKAQLHINKNHLFSLLNNLINNAVDALEEIDNKEIEIKVKQINNQVKIEISDNGPGIPEDISSKIFTPFFSTKPRTGTGLGLAICKKIVDIYKGDISMEMKLDKKTKFIIFLPSAPKY